MNNYIGFSDNMIRGFEASEHVVRKPRNTCSNTRSMLFQKTATKTARSAESSARCSPLAVQTSSGCSSKMEVLVKILSKMFVNIYAV